MSNVERIYWLDAQIRAQRYPNAQSLMDKYGISLRAARADAAHLRDCLEAPLRHNRRFNGWEYTEPHYTLPFLAFSQAEADTLRRTLLTALTHLPPTDSHLVGQLAAKLSPYIRGLPQWGGPPSPVLPEAFGGTVALAEGFLPSEALLADLRRATDRRYRIRLRYYSAHSNEITDRTVRPHSLLNWRGELYLIAWCELRQDFRDFFLSRIRAYEVLENEPSFTRDPNFDLDTFLSGPFLLHHGKEVVTVRARFSPYQSRWIRERIYHPSQQTEPQPDGSLILTLTVPGTEEIRRWLLSFGEDVEVLEPENLRADLRRTFVACTEQYSEK